MTPPCDYVADPSGIELSGRSVASRPAGSVDPGAGPITLGVLAERHQAHLPIADTMIDDALRTLRAAEALLD